MKFIRKFNAYENGENKNMNHTDEAIIKMMNVHKTGVSGSIEEGFIINEKEFNFKREFLFENKMSIMLPETFADMSLEAAKLKYPMEQRPQIIKTSEDTKINFTFSLIEQPLENEQVKEIVQFFKKVLRNAKPDINFIEEKIETIDLKTLGWFDFISNGYDQKIYNLMYFVPIDGKLMHGIFNCPQKDIANWKTVILQVMQRIKEIKQHKEMKKEGIRNL